MSEFLGQILGGLSGIAGAAAGMGGVLTQLLGTAEGSTGGGLPVLVAQFENAGLGAQVQSWIKGHNKLPVTAEQVAAAIPPEQLAAWAAKLDIEPQRLAEILAEVLPHAVDQATPGGALPRQGDPAANPPDRRPEP